VSKIKSISAENGLEVVFRDGTIIALIDDAMSLPLREEGFATAELMTGVEALARHQGWPEWAVKGIIDGCMHGRNIGLFGRIDKWTPELEKEFKEASQ
jgi:hypothetical protein